MIHQERFSRRFGHQGQEAPITVREDAPLSLRGAIVQVAYENGFTPKPLREVVCRVLKVRPDPSNWTERPNIEEEVQDLVDNCPWYRVYDIIEGIADTYKVFDQMRPYQPFERDINDVLIEQGIGWKLEGKRIVFRGPESLDTLLRVAVKTEVNAGHNTAANELHEAINDMSRRPQPDPTGAIQHSIASLECVARDVSGSKDTLGRWLQKNRDAFPRPLGEYVEKIWGFASEHGRHLVEAGEASMDEAELVLGLSATLGSYLSKKGKTFNENNGF